MFGKSYIFRAMSTFPHWLCLMLVLITSTTGLAQMDYTIRYFSVNDGLPDHRVRSMLKHSDGYLYLGTEKGVCRFDGYKAVPVLSTPVPAGLESNVVRGMWELEDGSILIGNRMSDLELDNFELINLQEGTSEGFPAVNREDSVEYVVIDGELIHAPERLSSSLMFEDEKGNRVVSYMDSATSKQIRYIELEDGERMDVSDTWSTFHGVGVVYSQDLSEGVFLGTSNGLVSLEFDRNPFGLFLHESAQEWEYKTKCRSIKEVSSDRFLISTEEKGLIVYDMTSGSESEIKLPGGERIQNVRGMYHNPDRNVVWLTPYKGTIIAVDTKTLRVRRAQPSGERSLHSAVVGDSILAMAQVVGSNEYQVAFFNLNSLEPWGDEIALRDYFNRDFRSAYLLESSNGKLWYGTNGGLFLINVETQTVEKAFFSKSLEGTGLRSPKVECHFVLSATDIMALHENDDGKLWIGLDEGGVDVLNPIANHVGHFDVSNGLSDNSVCGIIPDQTGYWFTTYHGLSHLDTATQLFRNFYMTNGLPHSEFNRFSFAKGDEYIYVGGMNGAARFAPSEVLGSESNLKIKLAEAGFFDRKEGKSIVKRQWDASGLSVVLPSANRSCYFDFTLNDLLSANMNTYAYSLQPAKVGSNTTWISNGTNRTIRFSYLPAGQYVLRVRGVNGKGVPSDEIEIRIDVEEYFYKTWWFIALMIGAGVLIVSLIYRYRLQQAIKVERLRTRLSSDLHDDVGGLLSGVAYQMELLGRTVDEKHKPLVTRVADSSRKAMVRMRDVIWAIDSRNSTLGDLELRMTEYANEQLPPLGIEFNWNKNGIAKEYELSAEIRHGLILIFKEFITNSIKHAGASRIDVDISKSQGRMTFSMKDNGRGADLSAASSGQGLKNMQMRAEKMRGEIAIKPEGGFCVEVVVNRV